MISCASLPSHLTGSSKNISLLCASLTIHLSQTSPENIFLADPPCFLNPAAFALMTECTD